jgi:hypothetical protein
VSALISIVGLGCCIVWAVANARRPDGALPLLPPLPARRGFATRREIRRRLSPDAARQTWTLMETDRAVRKDARDLPRA